MDKEELHNQNVSHSAAAEIILEKNSLVALGIPAAKGWGLWLQHGF